MVESVFLLPHSLHRLRISGKTPGSDGLGIDHGDDAVHRDAGSDFRPDEGLDQRLWQAQPGRFDNDMVGGGWVGWELFDGPEEILGNGSTKCGVGQLDDVFLAAGSN